MIVISYFAFLKGVTTASKYAPSFVTGYRVYTYLSFYCQTQVNKVFIKLRRGGKLMVGGCL